MSTTAAGSRVRAQSLDAARKTKIDSLLQRAVEAGDVPVSLPWRPIAMGSSTKARLASAYSADPRR
jgi:hypothetical protein